MRPFKFFKKNWHLSTRIRMVIVDYTTEYNGKSFTMLHLAEHDQDINNPNVKVYQGTFLGFKHFVDNHRIMNWNHNKPLIHLISFYSKKFSNCQALGYYDFFRQERRRFGKNQKIRIYYEIV